MQNLINKDKLLEQIKLQDGIYGMTKDEVINFIKEKSTN